MSIGESAVVCPTCQEPQVFGVVPLIGTAITWCRCGTRPVTRVFPGDDRYPEPGKRRKMERTETRVCARRGCGARFQARPGRQRDWCCVSCKFALQRQRRRQSA